ncbi:hypothetical protein Nepgr_021112 [Nepenthes gracilis]|uniref:Uncharacterized protein n=1 Tax=Nepenthes gracilis TaxID=150966 RepID=A0AAD3SYI0_NEPGR|nr:hypothetical protein Nepgr_021112 [Nepenthes gracilis]
MPRIYSQPFAFSVSLQKEFEYPVNSSAPLLSDCHPDFVKDHMVKDLVVQCPQFAEQIVAEDLEEAPAACPPPPAAVSLGLDDAGFEKNPRMMMPALDGQVAPACTGSVASTSQTLAFWPTEVQMEQPSSMDIQSIHAQIGNHLPLCSSLQREDIPEACTSSDFEGGKH